MAYLERDGVRVFYDSHGAGGVPVLLSHGFILTQQDGSVIDSLPSISVPVLVVVGSLDEAFLGASYMTAKIPGAQQVVIEGAGHVSNVDAPAQFNEAVSAFLAGLG